MAVELTTTTDDLRRSKMAELRAKLVDLDGEIVALGNKEVLDEAEEERWEDLMAERAASNPSSASSRHARRHAGNRGENLPRCSRDAGGDQTGCGVRRPRRDPHGLPGSPRRRVRIIGDKEQNNILSSHQQAVLDKLVRSDPSMAKRVLVTENDAYRSAWKKSVVETQPIYTHEEHEALLRFNEFRAQDEGTTTHGGFAIPVFIDPSVILTDQETNNPFLTLARTVNINTNTWKGVSAAGVTWSFDAEGTAVSDDSITLAQPSVTVFMARGFIPYTIEVEQDWPGFQAEMARLLSAGYDELLIDKFTRGSGTGEPMGVITALDATAASEVLLTTAAQFGQEDIYKAWAALPQKYQRNPAWMMHVGVNNRIRQMGTATLSHAFTVSLPPARPTRCSRHGSTTTRTSATSQQQPHTRMSRWSVTGRTTSSRNVPA